jgi:hypothetical protein
MLCVHDSFAVLAPHAFDFHVVNREQLAMMYDEMFKDGGPLALLRRYNNNIGDLTPCSAFMARFGSRYLRPPGRNSHGARSTIFAILDCSIPTIPIANTFAIAWRARSWKHRLV